jgi:hypothetical protein
MADKQEPAGDKPPVQPEDERGRQYDTGNTRAQAILGSVVAAVLVGGLALRRAWPEMPVLWKAGALVMGVGLVGYGVWRYRELTRKG